jgi:4-amino-4-deoxy-L-arabinose transferase-like glycosyltransferase
MALFVSLPRRHVVNRIAMAAILLAALAVRWPALHRDLYNDEALQTTISRSLIDDGRLNNFQYSKFTPDSQFRHGIWSYYPPGSNLIQAPFLLADTTSPVTARLPVLLLNLIVLAYLPALSAAIWKSTVPGWIAAILGAFGLFHIGMSVTSLSYTLAAPLQVMAFAMLVRAVTSGRNRDWVGLGLLIALDFYIMQIALVFGALLLAAMAWRGRRRRAAEMRGLLLCAVTTGVLCLPWLIWSWGTMSPASSFLNSAPDYSFAGQAGLVLAQYDLMLPSVVWKAAFLIGLLTVSRHALPPKEPFGVLLGLWALTPLLYLVSHNMWVGSRHVFGAYAAVSLLTGLGVTTATRWLLAHVLPHGDIRLPGRSAALAIAGTLVVTVAQFSAARASAGSLPPSPLKMVLLQGDAALEFGGSTAVSSACAYIRTHDRGEPIIAPVGISESHYVGRFVHDRRTPDATARAWELLRSGPAWVFMGDNYWHRGALDAFDRAVQQRGRLIMHFPPVPRFTAPDNSLGYALYYIDRPFPPLLSR